MSIQSDARDAFTDRFGGLLDEDLHLTDKGRDELPRDWQDDIAELADGLVPVYTTDVVREWLDAGCPDIDDAGLIEGVTDVTRIISAVMYEQYERALYELAYEAGFDR